MLTYEYVRDFIKGNGEIIESYAKFLASDLATKLRTEDYNVVRVLEGLYDAVYQTPVDCAVTYESIAAFAVKNSKKTLAECLKEAYYEDPESLNSGLMSRFDNMFGRYADSLREEELARLKDFMGDPTVIFGNDSLIPEIFYGIYDFNHVNSRLLSSINYISDTMSTYLKLAIITKDQYLFDNSLIFRACSLGGFYRSNITNRDEMAHHFSNVLRFSRNYFSKKSNDNLAELLVDAAPVKHLVNKSCSGGNATNSGLFALWSSTSALTKDNISLKAEVFETFCVERLFNDLTTKYQLPSGANSGNIDIELGMLYHSKETSDELKARLLKLVQNQVYECFMESTSAQYNSRNYGVAREVSVYLNLMLTITDRVDTFPEFVDNALAQLEKCFNYNKINLITLAVEVASTFYEVPISNKQLYTYLHSSGSHMLFEQEEVSVSRYGSLGRYEARYKLKRYGLKAILESIVSETSSIHRGGQILFTLENVAEEPELSGKAILDSNENTTDTEKLICYLVENLDYSTLDKFLVETESPNGFYKYGYVIASLELNKNLSNDERNSLMKRALTYFLTSRDFVQIPSALRHSNVNPLKILNGKC